MEREDSTSLEYLWGAVQHHLNTYRNLELFYCHPLGTYRPLTNMSAIRAGVKLKAKQVISFPFPPI